MKKGFTIITTAAGDTVSATGIRQVALGRAGPVEYRGYRFYSPSARARFIRTIKVKRRHDAIIPGIAYAGRMHLLLPNTSTSLPENYGYPPSTGTTIHTDIKGGR